LELPTHVVFGVAVGFVFFGRPEIALLVGLGALLPDLDREYWFIPTKQYRDEQYHRALLHNVFIIALAYLVSPFISLGIFLHVFQDSFTTAKDRGCEWLYPVTRLVKRGRKDANGDDEPLDPREHVYFYQEDPKGLLEEADPDLRVPGDRPCPWRRTYGPALNSQLLDRGFLFGSIAIIVVWLFASGAAHPTISLSSFTQTCVPCLVGYLAAGIVFAAGELDRRDRAEPLRAPGLAFMKKPLLVAGIALGCYCVFLFWTEMWMNLQAIVTNWVSVLLGVLVVALVCLVLIKWQTRAGRTATV
jgi:hypothetical protein